MVLCWFPIFIFDGNWDNKVEDKQGETQKEGYPPIPGHVTMESFQTNCKEASNENYQ